MSTSERAVLPDQMSLDGLTDRCSPVHDWRLRRRVLRIIWSATRTSLLVWLALIVVSFAYSYGWSTAVFVGLACLLLTAVLTVWVLRAVVPSRPRRHRGRRAAYVLSDGTA